MATDHNFRIKNGLEVGGQLIVTSSGALVVASVQSNLSFNDNIKAKFGNGSDLQIYHNGSNSIIQDAGTGKLLLGSDVLAIRNSALNEEMITATQNGAVKLFYDNSSKLETTSTGIDVTGRIDLDDSNTQLSSGSGNSLRIQTNYGQTEVGAQNTTWSHFYTDRPRFYFGKGITVDTGLIGSYDEDLQIQRAGTTKLTVTTTGVDIVGDLSITGDLNTVNTTTLDVSDKVITAGVGGTAATNDGGGFKISGANAEFIWDNTNTQMTLNKDLKFTASEKLRFGNTYFHKSGDSNNVHFYATGGLIPHHTTTSNNATLGASSYRWNGVYSSTGDFSGTITINQGGSFSKLDIKTSRTGATENIGGVQFYDSSNAQKSQLYGTNDGQLKLATNGSTVALTLNASQNATFAGTINSGTITATSNVNQLRLMRTDDAGDDWRFYSWTDGLNIYPSDEASTVWFGRDGGTTDVSVYNGNLKIGADTVIDSSRNLTNIGTISSGTISSGAITSSGQIRSTHTGASPSIWASTTDGYMQVGANGGGASGVFGAHRETTGTGVLDYTTYIGYDTYYDDGTKKWYANRTNLGRKWKTNFGGYHQNRFSISTYDGGGTTGSSLSAGWLEADWDERFGVDASGNATFAGTISSGAITSTGTSSFGAISLSGGVDFNGYNANGVNQINGASSSGWLDFNMDTDSVYPQSTSDNQTVLGSVTHMNFVGDSNGNGTGGRFYWGYGTDGADNGTFTTTMDLDRGGNLTTIGAIDATKISVDSGASLGLRVHTNSGITASNNYMNFFTGQTSGWSFNANATGADSDSVFTISPTGTINSGAITTTAAIKVLQPSSSTNNELLVLEADDPNADLIMTDNTGSIRLRTSGNGDFVLFTGGSATSQNASGSTQALLIDQAQNASFAGYVTSSDYLQHFSYLYSRDNLRVLNAAGNGWHDWATRSNGTFNLNVGTISSGAITATTVNTGHGANELYAMNQNVRTSDSPTFQDLTVQGNLSITGDINSYNVTDLDVTDKTITVGSGQTEANSGGSGLIVDGSGASLLWDEADNYWAMNKKLAFDSTPTVTNQGLGIIWTGFDKEGTTDPSDSASIYHTTNTGGHGGSVLLISSMNDSGDGIAFSTHGSSHLKHNSNNIFTDGYHPNADKWTTLRTLFLTGDVTGNVNWDGSGNATMTTVVGNDSHNHNHSDGNFTVNGVLQAGPGSNHISTSSAPFRWQRSSAGNTGQDDNVSVYVDDSNIYFTHNNDDDGDASGYHFRYMTGGTATNLLNFSSSTMTYKGNTVFHDGYHPNADVWTTARSHTVTLTGEVTGTATQSVNGSGNKTWSIATTLNNTALDDQYVDIAGDTMTGQLIIDNSSANPLELKRSSQVGIEFNDTSVGSRYLGVNGGNLFFGAALNHATNSKVFHDTYHPNADKWTTARSHTVTLTGEVTGTATQTVDGTGNKTWSIATTLNNSSLDDQYLKKDGANIQGYAAGTAEMFTWQNTTSGGKIQLGLQQNDTDGLHHRAYIKAYKGSATASGNVDLIVRGSGGSITSDVLELHHGQRAAWQGNDIFTDDYHPNADKWTTSRTLTLGGDLSGSVSFDGSANFTLTAAVANADTVDSLHASSFLRSDAADTATGALTFTGNINQTSGTFISNGDQVSNLTTAWQAAGTSKSRGLLPFRFQNGATGQPESGDNAHWGLNIYAHAGSSGNYPYGTQLSAGSTQNLWHRWWANGSAQAWRKIWDSENDGPSSGLNADLLDDQQGSYYLDYNNFTNKPTIPTNNNQLTNGAGYTSNTGTVTSIATGTGLDGTFTTSGTITLDLSELTDMTGAIDASVDEIIMLDNGEERRKRFSEIFGSNAYNSTTIPTNNNQLTNGAGYITDGNTNWNNSYGFITASDSSITNKLPLAGGTITGGLTISGSVDSGASNMGFYESAGTNLILKGDTNGRSGIFFESEKDGTNINDPSDYGFIQYHPYGYGGTSGEHADFVIGVSNDSADHVIIQSPYNGGVKVGYKDATSGTGLTTQTIFHDAYHPNADKWTTARSHTVTLTGDVTGTAAQSVDGTGNKTWSITTAVGNNSHQHSQLYENGIIDFGASYVQWTDQAGNGGTGMDGAAPRNPADGWYHNLIMNHGNNSGYYSQIATGLNTSDIYFSRVMGGSAQAWQRIFADDYHPNADKWTTDKAFLINLTGAVTGNATVQVDGSSNETWSISTSLASGDFGSNNIATSGYIETNGYYHDGDGNTGMVFPGVDQIDILAGGTTMMRFRQEDTNTDYISMFGASVSGEFLFYDNGNFHADGNITAYSSNTASDIRLKKNVRPLENCLDKVLSLDGVIFDWKKDSRGKDQVGFIAQQVEEHAPELVSISEDKDIGEVKTVNYDGAIPMLVEALKEQQSIINRLESRIKDLEDKG
jgi:hypothetical protein